MLFRSDGSRRNYPLTFEYIEESDVKVSIDNTVKTQGTHYTFANATTILFDSSHIPAANEAIRIYRDTDVASKRATFFSGSAIRAQDLNKNQDQVLFSSEERQAYSFDRVEGGTIESTVSLDPAVVDANAIETGEGHDIYLGVDSNVVFEGSAANDHETTLTVANPSADRTITFPDTTGTVVTTGDTGTVTSTMLANLDIVNEDISATADIAGSKLANDSVQATKLEHIEIGRAHV